MNNLDYYFLKFNTDKSSKHHNYSRQYDSIFELYRNKEKLKYLEIGVYQGGSINALSEYFTNYECILGLDITDTCKNYENIDKKIFIEIGDATKSDFINSIKDKYGTFDIILDDGSHMNTDVFTSFELLFPLLNDNGIYIVEDTNCCNSSIYVKPHYINHVEYFYQFIPFLNKSRHDFCADPFKINNKTDNIFEYSIDKIEFGCGYVCVYKKIREHWIP